MLSGKAQNGHFQSKTNKGFHIELIGENGDTMRVEDGVLKGLPVQSEFLWLRVFVGEVEYKVQHYGVVFSRNGQSTEMMYQTNKYIDDPILTKIKFATGECELAIGEITIIISGREVNAGSIFMKLQTLN